LRRVPSFVQRPHRVCSPIVSSSWTGVKPLPTSIYTPFVLIPSSFHVLSSGLGLCPPKPRLFPRTLPPFSTRRNSPPPRDSHSKQRRCYTLHLAPILDGNPFTSLQVAQPKFLSFHPAVSFPRFSLIFLLSGCFPLIPAGPPPPT